jgi:hypothetical protein
VYVSLFKIAIHVNYTSEFLKRFQSPAYQWRTQEFFSGGGGFEPRNIFSGGSSNSVEDRENGDRGR